MKIDFEIDLSCLETTPASEGQINIRLTKDQELRYKTLNLKHKKKLSLLTRTFVLKLMDQIEKAS